MRPYRSTMMVLWLCVHLLDWFRRLFFLSFNIWHSIDAFIVWGCDCFSGGLDEWIKNTGILTLAYTARLHCIQPSIRLSMQLFKPADENYDIKFWPFGALWDFLPDECRSDVLHTCNNCSTIGCMRVFAALHIQCILYINVFLNVIDVNFIQVNTMNGLRRFYVNIQLSWIYFNLSLSLPLCLSLYLSLCLLLSLSISLSCFRSISLSLSLILFHFIPQSQWIMAIGIVERGILKNYPTTEKRGKSFVTSINVFFSLIAIDVSKQYIKYVSILRPLCMWLLYENILTLEPISVVDFGIELNQRTETKSH